MLDFREARVVFTPNARVQVKRVAVDFGRVVNRGSVALQGFNMGYADDLSTSPQVGSQWYGSELC